MAKGYSAETTAFIKLANAHIGYIKQMRALIEQKLEEAKSKE